MVEVRIACTALMASVELRSFRCYLVFSVGQDLIQGDTRRGDRGAAQSLCTKRQELLLRGSGPRLPKPEKGALPEPTGSQGGWAREAECQSTNKSAGLKAGVSQKLKKQFYPFHWTAKSGPCIYTKVKGTKLR